MAYAELGQIRRTPASPRSTLSNSPQLIDMTNDVPVIQQRLQLYQNHQPFRQSFTNAPVKNESTEKLNLLHCAKHSPHPQIFQLRVSNQNARPATAAGKFVSASKCSASKPALVLVEASGWGGDINTTRALGRAPRGKASRVSKT